jgi:hypothetical protein
MDIFVSYQKLSKKKKREIDGAKRRTWGFVKPVTKVKSSAKLYSRKKKYEFE